MPEYYTPDITEFHVGFEFEAFEINKAEFIKGTFPETVSDIPTIKHLIGANRIRVQYLNEEDIAECGWERHNLNAVPCFHLGNFYLFLSLHRVSIDKGDEQTRSQYFRGEIKNKSELKLIMKLLGIK